MKTYRKPYPDQTQYYDAQRYGCERNGSTHRDHPVAHTQCAVSVCSSTLCNARDVDSLKTDETNMFKNSVCICG